MTVAWTHASDNTGVTGKYLSSEGKEGDAVWSTRAKWTLLGGEIEGKPVTVAILDHPSNVGYPTHWHARGYGLFAANPLGDSQFTKAKPFDLFSFISTVSTRQNAVVQAELKAAQNAAPGYLYLFTWQTPVLDGRPKAFHCAELAFVFDNIDRCENMTGGGPAARAMAAIITNGVASPSSAGEMKISNVTMVRTSPVTI